MDIVIPSAILALISAIVTEILKLTFMRNLGYDYQKIIAFLIAFLTVSIYILSIQIPVFFQDVLTMFIFTLCISYGIWKSIFKPIEVMVVRARKKRATK